MNAKIFIIASLVVIYVIISSSIFFQPLLEESHDYDKSTINGTSQATATCELPPCNLVLKSRLYSERCQTNVSRWPLLITGTPRSATVFATKTLQSHGLKITDDWHATPTEDGIVSWMFAFEDPNNFSPTRTGGYKFHRVLHQVKEPLGSITSMCTEPILTPNDSGLSELDFLRRHLPMNSTYESQPKPSRAVLEFWVEWHKFLTEMRFPTYQIEQVSMLDICQVSALGHKCHAQSKNMGKKNARSHRDQFSWQELYTIDPQLAKMAWELAHYYGYEYPDVNFDELTCLDYFPSCTGDNGKIVQSEKCPPGTHPHPTNTSHIVPRPTSISGMKGWVDSGCIEYKSMNGSFVGVEGLALIGDYLIAKEELDPWSVLSNL